jgi:hypothetical protein
VTTVSDCNTAVCIAACQAVDINVAVGVQVLLVAPTRALAHVLTSLLDPLAAPCRVRHRACSN